MKVALNLNDKVWVRLTRKGRAVLRQWQKASSVDGKNVDPNTGTQGQKKGGWLQFQLWELMQIFGTNCVMGMSVPFQKNEIVLLESDL